MNSDNPVNFYFGNLKNSELIAKKDDNSYIILQNDHLHKKVEELQNELYELKKLCENLENDNESLETSKTSLKGYIKNEGEYNRISSKLVEYYDKKINSIENLNNVFIWNFKKYALIFLSIDFSIFIVHVYSCNFQLMFEIIIINIILFYIIYNVFYNIIFVMYSNLILVTDIKNDREVIRLKSELKECEKGNDYLNNLVDII